MKKLLIYTFILSLSALSASELTVTDSLSINPIEEKITEIEKMALIAIENEDYDYIENVLSSGAISPRAVVNGKPLIIHAAIQDKAEMILLLASYGAMINNPICDEGKDIMEYAKENNAIHAQAQIIIIRA
jgi:ankyrin repeat protein